MHLLRGYEYVAGIDRPVGLTCLPRHIFLMHSTFKSNLEISYIREHKNYLPGREGFLTTAGLVTCFVVISGRRANGLFDGKQYVSIYSTRLWEITA